MYIAVFIGKKNEDLDKIETLGDVLEMVVNLMHSEDCKWGDIGSIYESKEVFVEDLDTFMGDNCDGYVIGVDVSTDAFEVMRIKYVWAVEPI